MKRINKYIILTIISLFVFVPFVYAEDTTTDDSFCSSMIYNSLVKEVKNVTGTYEFVYNENGQVIGFNYLIFNVPDGISVSYKIKDELEVGDVIVNVDIDEETGVGKVFDSNLTDTYTRVFTVYTSKYTCNTLKSISITKPRFNEFSESEECNHYEVQDFIYCQPWVTQTFPLNQEQILQKINDKKKKEREKTTAFCVYCEENAKNAKLYNTLVAIRKYAIIGLAIGILIDIIVIIMSLKRIKENRIL